MKTEETPKLNFQEILKPAKTIWEPHIPNVQKAFERICTNWNKDEKTRSFIKHLIISHIPINDNNRLTSVNKVSKPKCAILGFDLNGLTNITEGFVDFSKRKLAIKTNSLVEKRKLNQSEIEEIRVLQSKYDKSILFGSVAYASEKTDKYLSKEALLALHIFCQEMMLESDHICEIITIKRKNQQKLEQKAKQKKFNTPLKQSLSDCKGAEKLQKLFADGNK